ncbi:hypothetical protein L798_14450 [Zootermopsis nevadensis]|uniref:DDE Tnp4 domain-containing protein n=1 Tax=Zootermopsis nevadensis TaxID=136037 RepID=A0A067QQT8_ZOONE|nr:hypothetical protein L798_14450 [Zootermopsis nevadensis]
MIESVFGIIVERFAVLQKPISFIDLTSVRHIVMACCALHNFLRSKIPNQYTPLQCLDDEDFETGNVTPGYRCNQFMDLERRQWYFPSQDAKLVRELFLEYFNNEGKVPWQDKFCF